MSGSSTNTVVPLILDKAGVYDISQLYDANNPVSGTYFPTLYTIVLVNGAGYYVNSVNTTNWTWTKAPLSLSDESDGFGLSSIVSYGNDIFRAYYDTRQTPYVLRIDQSLYVMGGSPKTYTISRYPNTPQETIISKCYDATGLYTGNACPMLQVANGVNSWYPSSCQISVTLNDDEELLMMVYNEVGAQVATTKLFAKESIIINDAMIYRPRISAISMTCTQMTADGNAFIFAQQPLSSLDIQATITYQDGTTRIAPIDSRQCFLYGQTDFVAAYAGMQQTLLLKYFLSSDEVLATTVNSADTSDGSISCVFNVTVVPNRLSSPLKISVIPQWNATASLYTLRYYYYSTDGLVAQDVTAFVTILSGTFVGNNYTTPQVLQISMDMHAVDPITYPTTTVYVQPVSIKLQPQAALVRYTLQDALSSPYIYGADSSASRRPVMYYDATRNQYFFPSSIFQNVSAFLQSYYYNANPPYDPTLQTSAIAPTHFLIRDAFKGTQIIPEIQPVSNYNVAFTINGGSNGAYVNATVIVEFVQQLSLSSTSILFGVPVDVYTGTYQGP